MTLRSLFLGAVIVLFVPGSVLASGAEQVREREEIAQALEEDDCKGSACAASRVDLDDALAEEEREAEAARLAAEERRRARREKENSFYLDAIDSIDVSFTE